MSRRGQRQLALAILMGLLTLAVGCAKKRLAPPEIAVEEVDELSDELAGEGLDEMREDIALLRKLSDPLRLLAAEQCQDDNLVPYVGVILETTGQAVPTPLDRVRTERGVAVLPTVVRVMPSSPAERAGLRAGDIIYSFNRKRVIFHQDFIRRLTLDSRGLPLELRKAPLLEIERAGERFDAQLDYRPACTGPVALSLSGTLTTWHFGAPTSRLAVSRGLMDFVQNDDELVILMAHELAHMAIDNVRESRRFKREVEERADRMSLELAVRAGYDISVAVGIWERIAVQRPWMITRHPKQERRGGVRHGHIASRTLLMPTVIEQLDRRDNRRRRGK